MRTFFLASILALSGVASAQNCGTLAITGTGAAGTTLTFGVTGTTARGLVTLALAENTGSTTINLGPLNLTLGLATPILPLPLGRADANGDVSVSLTVPNGIPQQIALNAQGATFAFTIRPFSLSACATNVVAFTIG